MTLHAILNWYDESPTWLAGCVASLSKIGVEHLIAVDGRYPHFAAGSPTRSAVDQLDAITATADGIGIALTLHTIQHPLMEPQKRSLAFSLLEATATYHTDWALVIDADEIIAEGDPVIARQLAELDHDTHVASARVSSTVDPYDEPGADNDVTDRTQQIHQMLPTPQTYTHLQSRFWRVLKNMRCDASHFSYVGEDANGVVWNLRGDIGTAIDGTVVSDIARPEQMPRLLHRKNMRTMHRQTMKRDYYTTRDSLGLERRPAQV